MSRYPDNPRPKAPIAFRSNRPFVSGGPVWAPQTRGLTRYGLGEADLAYDCLTWAEVKTLYDFFESVGGPAGRFTFADFNGIDEGGRAWSSLFVAKSDGFTIAWDLPTFALVADPAPVVYANGYVQTSEIVVTTPDTAKAYHIYLGTGTDGVDKMTAQASLTTVATAPSPATTGTSLVVAAGTGASFPSTPFYASIWPTAVAPTALNAEIVYVTGRTTDTLTISRATAPAYVRTVIVGDQIAAPPARSVILTISGTCRRAFRRARFTAALNPFGFDVPEIGAQGPVTIAEVRK